MRTIAAVIFLFFYFIIALPVLGVEWIIGKWNKPLADISQLRMVQWGFRCIMFIAGTKLIVKGYENVPKDEAVLYIGNHRGFWDVVTTYSLCPGLTGYISKDSIEKVPVLGLIMKRLYCLFMDREDMKQSLKVILTAIDYIKQGISICIFPEGSRNKDKDHPESLLPFKDGSFKIAAKSGCKVVPMAITGSAEVLENHFPWIHKSVVTVVYGEPVVLKELDKGIQKKPGEYFRKLIGDMLEKEVSCQKSVAEYPASKELE